MSEDAHLTLYTAEAGSEVYISSDVDTRCFTDRVLFSFGSGEWLDGAEASEVMEDIAGKWLPMSLTSMNARIILDKKGLVEPFDNIPSDLINKVITLTDAFNAFEQLGEVAVRVSHHVIKRSDDGVSTIAANNKLVFVCSQPKKEKETKKGKKKAPKKGKKAKESKAKGKKKAAKEAPTMLRLARIC